MKKKIITSFKTKSVKTFYSEVENLSRVTSEIDERGARLASEFDSSLKLTNNSVSESIASIEFDSPVFVKLDIFNGDVSVCASLSLGWLSTEIVKQIINCNIGLLYVQFFNFERAFALITYLLQYCLFLYEISQASHLPRLPLLMTV